MLEPLITNGKFLFLFNLKIAPNLLSGEDTLLKSLLERLLSPINFIGYLVLINKPSIVLLDEPMAALDPIVVQDIQKYILKLQNFGCAILVTDLQVNNLFDIVDRAYVLGEQSVIAEGTSRELLKSSKAIEHYFGSQF